MDDTAYTELKYLEGKAHQLANDAGNVAKDARHVQLVAASMLANENTRRSKTKKWWRRRK